MSKIKRNLLQEVCWDYEQERIKLTKENKNLKHIIQEIFWMARRYAHGRHTYAPSIVRQCYKTISCNINVRVFFFDRFIDENKQSDRDKIGTFENFDFLNDCNY